MRHEPVEILRGQTRRREGVLHDVGDHADREAKHFLAFHSQMADRLGSRTGRRRRAA